MFNLFPTYFAIELRKYYLCHFNFEDFIYIKKCYTTVKTKIIALQKHLKIILFKGIDAYCKFNIHNISNNVE